MRDRDRGQKLFEGKIQHHGRFAFLLSETKGQEDLMLRGPTLGLAMHGDRVLARLTKGTKDRPAGEIVKVLKRARENVTGVLRLRAGKWIAVPEESDERDAIRVLGFIKGIIPREGEVVVVKITQWPTLTTTAGGEVREAIGIPGESGVRLRAVLRTRDLPDAFPEPVLAESRDFPDEVSSEMWQGRLDLREVPIFTIDGADAKDFDDAVSLEIVEGGLTRLGVHIADVSHYVKKGTALDGEAASRATSVYLADRVVPMLPPKLSDHLCSLRPDVERLTLSCFMDLDAAGKVVHSFLKETVIRSHRRFTYEEVESVLTGKHVANVSDPIRDIVLRMGKLFKTLHLKRLRRGALDMGVTEYQVKVDDKGNPIEVVKRPRLDSHRLIEEFMLLANETVASTLLARGLPFLSRIHPDPEPRKLEVFAAELRKLGYFAPGTLASRPAVAMQTVLNKAVGDPLEETINMLVMRSLMQATYSHAPGAHFGLASEAYCHFTSPIRRYPDLLVHRAVRVLLQESQDRSYAEGIEKLGVHCSERERIAADAERRSVDILRAELLVDKVGKIFDGVVSGSAAFGLFVTLEGLGASGLVRGANAALGTRVKVKLDRVDPGKGELDLSILGDNKPKLPTDTKPKPAFAPVKPRFDSVTQKFNPPPSRGDKPRWGEKPRWDPSKRREEPRRFDPSKPKFDPARAKFDPSKPREEKRQWGPKPKFDPSVRREKPRWDPSKPKFDPSKRRDEPRRFDPSKPKFDPAKARFDPSKPREEKRPWGPKPKFDPNRPKFDSTRGEKPRWDPSRPKFDPSKRRDGPKRFDSFKKYDPAKPKYDPAKPKFDHSKPQQDSKFKPSAEPAAKPKFYDRFIKKPRRD